MDRPEFRVAVVGDADPGLVVRKLAELLRRKLTTHAVTVYAGGTVALPVFVWCEDRGIPSERIGETDDELGSYRNARLLNTCTAFIAFGDPSAWPRDVADLVRRVAGSKV